MKRENNFRFEKKLELFNNLYEMKYVNEAIAALSWCQPLPISAR